MLSLGEPLVRLADKEPRRAGRLRRPFQTAQDVGGSQSVTDVAELRMTTAAGLEATRRNLLLRTLSWILLAFTLLLPLALWKDLSTTPWTTWIHLSTYLTLVFVWYRHERLSSNTIALALLSALYALGTVGLLRTGIVGINGLAYGLLAIATPLVFGLRAGILAAALCGLTYAVIGTLTVEGVLTHDLNPSEYALSALNWIHTGAAFLAYATMAVVISGTTSRKLQDLLHSEAARSQMLTATNARLAEANARLHELNAELEARIGERTRSLEEANRELESFSYTVSHDLRSPLQVIEGFSSLALQEDGSGSTAKAREYLHKIQGGARRMHDMIGHLLKFSQLGSRVVQREPVNLSELAERILVDLHVAEPGRRVEFSIEPDMLETADPELIGNVLHNLLANAWKFSSRAAAARIEFSRRNCGGRFTYQVCDNGVGFDTCAAQRLFQPFVRLHDKREFQGSGVGLATAKRIIDRHNGKIWVESQPGEGAKFFFTLASQ
jgi:signal transduction histidine kinase